MSTTLFLHHHGQFTPSPNVNYIGGVTEVINEFDSDLLSFRDMEEFAEKYSYDAANSLVYFKTDGHTFKKGTRLIYDDNSVRDLVKIYMPYGRIELYVDHFEIDDLVDENTKNAKETENVCENETVGDNGVETHSGDEENEVEFTDDSDDPEYKNNESEFTDDSDDSDDYEDESLVPEQEVSDDELENIRNKCKKFKDNMYNAMNIPNQSASDDSVYGGETLRSLSSSSEDENAKIGYVGPPNPKRRKFSKKTKIDGVPRFEVGMKFVNMAEFRDTVRRYGVVDRRRVQFVTNDGRRCQVCCEVKCPFYIWCSRDKDSETCTIKTLVDNHLCTKPYTNKMANVKYLCELFGERIRKNPQWKCKEMAETIKNELEIDVPRIKILRLRKAALEGVAESLKVHYSRVRDFGQEVLLSNPQNTVKIATTRLNENDLVRFKRIYVCYFALKEGWKGGCRPVIGLDGCFLKTVCGGQLLSAVGRDGNNQMFPICYAVVESENTDSWRWFITLLKDDLDLNDGRGLTVISDQQKGLENAVKELLPSVEHRFCTRHLCANFKNRFKSSLLKGLFWNIAIATHKVAYTKAMREMERASKPAHEQLSKIAPNQWCKAFFSTHSLVDSTDNNMSESFNSWIINERYMPLLTMLQEIHYKMMKRMREKRDEMLATDLQLCPKIKKYLDVLVTESRKWSAAWDGDKKFLVKLGTRIVTVDLDSGTCDCRVFDLTGIPCKHAIAAIHSRRHNPQDYVSEFYKRDKYLASYKHSLEAMKGEEYWDFHSTEVLLPPPIPKKLRGRPKKLRRREVWEGGSRSQAQSSQGVTLQRYSNKRVMHCSCCGDASHRVSNCPDKPKDGTILNKAKVQKSTTTPTEGKKKSAREQKRQKLNVRRKPQKGVLIKKSHNTKTDGNTAVNTSEKGKEKMVENYSEEEMEDLNEEQFQNLFEETYMKYDEIPPKKDLVEGGEEGEDFNEDQPIAFMKKVPRKKHPFVKGQEADEWEKSGQNFAKFQEKLRGPIGYKALFMPTPRLHCQGLLPMSHQGGTPPASTPPVVPVPVNQGGGRSATFVAPRRVHQGLTPKPRRSVRLSRKKQFKWSNTKEDPVQLGD